MTSTRTFRWGDHHPLGSLRPTPEWCPTIQPPIHHPYSPTWVSPILLDLLQCLMDPPWTHLPLPFCLSHPPFLLPWQQTTKTKDQSLAPILRSSHLPSRKSKTTTQCWKRQGCQPCYWLHLGMKNLTSVQLHQLLQTTFKPCCSTKLSSWGHQPCGQLLCSSRLHNSWCSNSTQPQLRSCQGEEGSLPQLPCLGLQSTPHPSQPVPPSHPSQSFPHCQPAVTVSHPTLLQGSTPASAPKGPTHPWSQWRMMTPSLTTSLQRCLLMPSSTAAGSRSPLTAHHRAQLAQLPHPLQQERPQHISKFRNTSKLPKSSVCCFTSNRKLFLYWKSAHMKYPIEIIFKRHAGITRHIPNTVHMKYEYQIVIPFT